VTNGYSRRSVLAKSSASLTAAGLLAGCLGDNDDGDSLTFYKWGGSTGEALDEYLVKPFEEEYEVTVQQSEFGSEDDMLADVRTSSEGTYDIIMPSTSGIYNVAQQELVEPLRTDDMDNWSNLLDVFQDFSVDPGDEAHAVPLYYGTTGMVYNEEEVDDEPPFSWSEAWNEDLDGRIIKQDLATIRLFTTALQVDNRFTDLYRGLPEEEVQDGDEEEAEQEVWDLLAEQQQLINTYWSSGDDMVNLYRNEEAFIGDGWGGRILALQDEGYDQIQYTIPEEGAAAWVDGMAIAKGTEKRDLAEKFIDFSLSDEVMEKLSPTVGYPPTTDIESDDVVDLPDYDETGGEGLRFRDPEFEEEHQSRWTEVFDQIKMGEY
jgi:spermidine/putrescine-binding protein